jgi:hypothetical protein
VRPWHTHTFLNLPQLLEVSCFAPTKQRMGKLKWTSVQHSTDNDVKVPVTLNYAIAKWYSAIFFLCGYGFDQSICANLFNATVLRETWYKMNSFMQFSEDYIQSKHCKVAGVDMCREVCPIQILVFLWRTVTSFSVPVRPGTVQYCSTVAVQYSTVLWLGYPAY